MAIEEGECRFFVPGAQRRVEKRTAKNAIHLGDKGGNLLGQRGGCAPRGSAYCGQAALC